MPQFTTDKLRNVVLLSHSGAGKTILSEAMLHRAGITTRMGSVEDGTAASDFEPEEARRGSSIQTSILAFPWRGNKINVLDTPGYADFRAEAMSGIPQACTTRSASAAMSSGIFDKSVSRRTMENDRR